MKPFQKDIFFLAGTSIGDLLDSPFLERFEDKGVEVLFLTDPVDEYMMQQIRDYAGKKFISVASENAKIE